MIVKTLPLGPMLPSLKVWGRVDSLLRETPPWHWAYQGLLNIRQACDRAMEGMMTAATFQLAYDAQASDRAISQMMDAFHHLSVEREGRCLFCTATTTE